MKIAKIPANELNRLEELDNYQILDTQEERKFDDVTQFASQVFKVPMVLISLVDRERQWFKSKVGLQADQTPRDVSFCAHAILGDDVFVVSDSSKDERFVDNPLVLESPHVRFYAGALLQTPSGYNLGTFCLIDQKPRQFSVEQLDRLKLFARIVMDQFELSRRIYDEVKNLHRVHDEEQKFRLVFDYSPLAQVQLDAQFRFIEVNSAFVRLLGYSREELQCLDIFDITHPDDLMVSKGLMAQFANPEFKLEKLQKRYLAKDGRIVWVQISIRSMVRHSLGDFRLFSAIEDISATKMIELGHEKNQELWFDLQKTKQDLTCALQLIPFGVYHTDAQGNYLFVNESWCHLTGMSPEQAFGKGWMAGIHPADLEGTRVEWGKSIEKKQAFNLMYRLLRPDGTTTNIHATVSEVKNAAGLLTGYFGFVRDLISQTNEDALNNFYRVALDQAAMIEFTDPSGKITYANELFCQVSGYALDELIGQDHRLVNSGKMGSDFFRSLWQTISSGKQWQGEICNRAKTGNLFWVYTTIVPFVGPTGSIERYIAIRRDRGTTGGTE
jgi:PAS domain S-box-containing protein